MLLKAKTFALSRNFSAGRNVRSNTVLLIFIADDLRELLRTQEVL